MESLHLRAQLERHRERRLAQVVVFDEHDVHVVDTRLLRTDVQIVAPGSVAPTHSFWMCSVGPAASPETEPSGSLCTQPRRPSALACCTVVWRNETPCTEPVTA